MVVTGLLGQDQSTRANAFTKYPGQVIPGYAVPAYLDYTVDWFDPIDRYSIKSGRYDFAGTFVQSKAKVSWSAVQNGRITTEDDGLFTGFDPDPYRFDAEGSDQTVFATVGRERNGRYYSG